MQMVLGLVIVGGAFVASQVLGLFTLNWLLNNFLGSLFVILVVIFQADIRRALTRVGAQSFLGRNAATVTACGGNRDCRGVVLDPSSRRADSDRARRRAGRVRREWQNH